MRKIYAGIDLETTGTKRAIHKIIQIGISTEDGFDYVTDINPFHGLSDYEIACGWDEEARAVNGFSNERVAAAPWKIEAEESLVKAAKEFYGEEVRFIGVGWNIGSFDLPFIQEQLPVFDRWLSYRSVDLNAILFTIDEARKGMKGVLRFDGLKKAAKTWASETLKIKGVEEKWHDALYDSKAALLSWRYLVNLIGPAVRD